MNSRSLTPFLISFALVLCAGVLPRRATAAPESVAPHTLTQAQLQSELSRQLYAHFNWEGDLQLELLRPWASLDSAAAPIEVVVIDYPATASSTLLVRARFVSAGVVLGEAALSLRVQLWREVWATRQPVERGSLFDPTALEVRRVDVLRERDCLPAATTTSDYTFSRSLPADRLLTWRDVARRSLVRKGELVEVSASDGALRVTMKALAMQSGAAGDMVTVRNLESRKDITAQVVAENRVQVRF